VTLVEGTVNSQLDGQPAHVFHHGENWAEEPGAHHLATENTSATEPRSCRSSSSRPPENS
jgi:quercetin dioxygenase-like cupin family protein